MIIIFSCQMYGLMNQISDIYNQRLLEYADKQEIFDIKMYAKLLWSFLCEFFDKIRLNGQYTLDNIASCLFGVETNSLQNENGTLVTHLKKFFDLGARNLLFIVICKIVLNEDTYFSVFLNLVISPRFGAYLQKKGISIFPMDAVNYTTNIVNQILSRRRQHLERRNDFIQMMVDCEQEEKESQQEEQNDNKQGQQWGTLKKSNYYSIYMLGFTVCA